MYHDDPYDRSHRSGGLRASDSEREQTADALRRNHTEGRLSDAEFEQRLARCYQARTLAELETLTGDLPRGGGLSAWPGGWSPARGGRPPLGVLVLGGIVGVWLLGALASIGSWGAGVGFHHPHPPLILPLLVIGGLVWLFSRRRRVGR